MVTQAVFLFLPREARLHSWSCVVVKAEQVCDSDTEGEQIKAKHRFLEQSLAGIDTEVRARHHRAHHGPSECFGAAAGGNVSARSAWAPE